MVNLRVTGNTRRLAKAAKTSAEQQGYTLDYSKWLLGATISTVQIVITAAGFVLVPISGLQSVSPAASGSLVTFELADGDLGEEYNIVVTITTNTGLVKQDLIIVSVRDKASVTAATANVDEFPDILQPSALAGAYPGVTGVGILVDLVVHPAASATPVNNGDLTIEATSNTSLTFKYKGSDGVVRSASLTLS